MVDGIQKTFIESHSNGRSGETGELDGSTDGNQRVAAVVVKLSRLQSAPRGFRIKIPSQVRSSFHSLPKLEDEWKEFAAGFLFK